MDDFSSRTRLSFTTVYVLGTHYLWTFLAIKWVYMCLIEFNTLYVYPNVSF